MHLAADEARQVRRRACRRKNRYGLTTAKAVASDVRDRTGEDVRAYRCPFCRRWHVGHTPGMATLRRIAAAIRRLSRGDA